MPHWFPLALFTVVAVALSFLSFEPPFRPWSDVLHQDVYSEAVIALLLCTWVVLLHRIKLSKLAFWLLYSGSSLMALAALEDLEDEFMLAEGLVSQGIENIASPVGMLLISLGLYHWGSEQRRTRQHLQGLTETDALTGLGNRASFNTHLGSLAAQDFKRALLFMDIDNFKNVNDTYGHATGDQVIKQLAKIMQASIREQDLAFRFGGEEFAVLIEKTTPRAVGQIAQRILSGFSEHKFELDAQHSFSCTVSIGIAYADEVITPEDWLEAADQALYSAKHRGKNRAVIYQPDNSAQEKS